MYVPRTSAVGRAENWGTNAPKETGQARQKVVDLKVGKGLVWRGACRSRPVEDFLQMVVQNPGCVYGICRIRPADSPSNSQQAVAAECIAMTPRC